MYRPFVLVYDISCFEFAIIVPAITQQYARSDLEHRITDMQPSAFLGIRAQQVARCKQPFRERRGRSQKGAFIGPSVPPAEATEPKRCDKMRAMGF